MVTDVVHSGPMVLDTPVAGARFSDEAIRLTWTDPLPVADTGVGYGDHGEILAALQEAFGVTFALWDGRTGEPLSMPSPAWGDPLAQAELVRRVAARGTVELIADADAVVMLAVPMATSPLKTVVAVAPFAVRSWTPAEPLDEVARFLNCSLDQARQWWQQQQVWPADILCRMATAVARRICAEQSIARLKREVENLTENLTATYEEISLLYAVTQHLRISTQDTQLGQVALEWLQECVPAECLVAQYLPVARADEVTYKARTEPVLLVVGEPLVDNTTFTELIAHLQLSAQSAPRVLNRNITSQTHWPFPQLRQLIVVPLVENNNLYGWMAAINHRLDKEFGTVEAKLLHSVATILGVHSANRELYRQQAEFLASVVRTLVSAIDARDAYTCGHSDRVARIAVRLARELNCPPHLIQTIYMAGLLHDIGKIGIDDQILRKPGALTAEEFEQIKKHPELGYRILADLRPMADVLPIVLHHHEQWDGRGYPCGLRAEETPLLARITAVADAFDAMTSDRPYRKGMPIEKVEEIFRKGAGQQWDPDVIAAYFRCRNDILAITSRERANLSLDVERWFIAEGL
jgi:putative nucleotidyltransferase with HDIG domain